jgi:hypothetical protein
MTTRIQVNREKKQEKVRMNPMHRGVMMTVRVANHKNQSLGPEKCSATLLEIFPREGVMRFF